MSFCAILKYTYMFHAFSFDLLKTVYRITKGKSIVNEGQAD